MNPSIFREYDIRGVVDRDLNEKSVKLIGYFLGKKIKEKGGVVSVGYDARLHSPLLRDYLVSGLNFAGCKVYDIGLVPTPVSYFSNYRFPYEKIDGSIMITGSHNPKEYNGFKITIDKKPFFGEDIYRLRDEILKNENLEIPTNLEREEVDIKPLYIEYLVNDFKELKGFDKEIIVDCGNGAVGVVLEDILKELDIKYTPLFCNPDGNFPNHHPDPSIEENLKDLKEKMKEKSAPLGFAYDGDGDRIATLTPKRSIKGDELAILFAKEMENPVVIGEVKCSKIMYDELEKMGATPIMYKTGHSNIKVKMKEVNASLACEVSGHIFFMDRYFGYDDAIYATFRVLELVKNGIDLDKELDALPKLFSTDELKVKTTDEEKFLIIENITEILKNPPKTFPKIVEIIDVDGVRINFENGWALVRASNTTPILVTRFEAKTKEDLEKYQREINRLIEDVKELLREKEDAK
ncbi:MAG: phosphomannomutase/phosphoglucomutase [Epsilonproteobacteria bacterium]|nr:phosphomannomutase/phosphoglucomutase [Campylobacterota bacterium]